MLMNWRFREIFSLVGAVLFGILALLQITGIYEISTILPESVTGFIPGVDFGTQLAALALIALVGTALFVYTRVQDEIKLPEESTS